MGFSITWCAVRENGAPELLQQLRLSPTGETEELPESLISSLKLDSGWRVLWYNEIECPFLQPSDLEAISKDEEVLLCLIEEHVMVSSAEFWSGGARQWRIAHEGESGPKGLTVEGVPPKSLQTIRGHYEDAQLASGGEGADVDYLFEIPLAVAESIVGFKHDATSPQAGGAQFQVLKRTSRTRGFFERLLGK